MLEKIKMEWFSNIRADILAGIVVALALIPEAIGFSFMAGVDPSVGLYASICFAIVIAFTGGRLGMISAATGSMAALMGPLVVSYGLDYLLAATILTGIIQIVFGVSKVARVMKFIPRAVMIGFVNALAVIIFSAQIPHLIGVTNMTYVFVAATLLIVYIAPRFIKGIPAPLIAVLTLTPMVIFGHVNVNTVGDLGTIPTTLPALYIPEVPFNFETIKTVFPFSLALALVGLLESLLTAATLDEMTDTDSDKNKESRGQGIANIITGFFGGMAGCAMIGQSVININSGGRSRLSTLTAGLFLLILLKFLGGLLLTIPMPVLVGIMIMVCMKTFDWSSFRYVRSAPKGDAIVMLVTVFTVVFTSDLSKGVIAGVLLSAIFFVMKLSKIQVNRKDESLGYSVEGHLFFASVDEFVDSFDFNIKNSTLTIDFSKANIWDDSAVNAIDKVIMKYKSSNNEIRIIGLNAQGKRLVSQVGAYQKMNI